MPSVFQKQYSQRGTWVLKGQEAEFLYPRYNSYTLINIGDYCFGC